MNRLALLIGATFADLEIVSTDIAKMKNYLESVTGGAWNSNEIRPIIDAPLRLLKGELADVKAKNLDFLLIYWSGHGGYSIEAEEIFIDVTAEDRMLESGFHQLAKRQLVIFDTCNAIPEEVGLESFTESLKFRIAASATDRLKARAYYESLIMASGGLQKAYSCSIREYSTADDILGSIYTREILKQARAWSGQQTKQNFLTIKEVAKLATPKCVEYDQRPRMAGPKSFEPHQFYPFAVKV